MENNNKIIDRWTVQHFLGGFLLGHFFPKREVGYSLIIGYEIVENILMRSQFADFFKEIEGLTNAVADSVIGIVAYELNKKYGDKKI